jgi:cation diffusion facilitator CzcD-associated flavoprotein CzcO
MSVSRIRCPMVDPADVAIVGAGPYGLSIAAHLHDRGIRYRIIGSPMQFWVSHMPDGMQLKSEGFAISAHSMGFPMPT